MKLNIIHKIDDIYNDNVDVQVELDQKCYVATFFTIQNISTLMSNHRISGECLGGKYFWASDMIIVDKLEEEGLKNIILEMISSGEFYDTFSCIS